MEHVGDGDRRHCQQRDSVPSKVGRLVLHHGSIEAAREAAPVQLGKLVSAWKPVHNNLPQLVPGQTYEERGHWAAKHISAKPRPRAQMAHDAEHDMARREELRLALAPLLAREVSEVRFGVELTVGDRHVPPLHPSIPELRCALPYLCIYSRV